MEQNNGKIDGVKFISDDIIIYAPDEQDLLRKLELLFIKTRARGLKLNFKKCIFAQEKKTFLVLKYSKMVLILIQFAAYVNCLVTKMAPKSVSLEDIKSEAAKDIRLVAVKTALLSG